MPNYMKILIIILGATVTIASATIVYTLISNGLLFNTNVVEQEGVTEEVEKTVAAGEANMPSEFDEYVVHIGSSTKYIGKNELITRNGELLVNIEANVFTSLGINISFDNVANKFSYIYLDENKAEHVVTNYLKELVWYKDGLNVHTSECRSEEGYVPFKAVMSARGYSVTFNTENNSIEIER